MERLWASERLLRTVFHSLFCIWKRKSDQLLLIGCEQAQHDLGADAVRYRHTTSNLLPIWDDWRRHAETGTYRTTETEPLSHHVEKSVTCCRRTSSLDHCLSGEQTSFSLATETLGLIYYDSSCVLKTNEVKGGNVESPWVHAGWQCHLHTDGCYSLWDPGTLKGCLQCCQLWLSGSSVHHLVLPTALCICSRISILMLEVIGFRSRQLLWARRGVHSIQRTSCV